MEKILKKSLIAFMLILTATVSLTSCKDDDDKASPSSKLVGTWVCDYGLETFTYIFNSNNTGREMWVSQSPYDAGSNNFTWSATETILIINYEDGDTWSCSYSISSDGKTLILDGDPYIKR